MGILLTIVVVLGIPLGVGAARVQLRARRRRGG